jgi:elongation factor G
MLKRQVLPLFCVAAKRNMGSGRMMGFIGNVAPSAGDIHPEHDKEGNEIPIDAPDTNLFVFKAANEKHAGQMSFFKVCSGEVASGMELYNTTSNSSGKLNQLYAVDGKNRISVDKLAAGDIGATVKFKNTHVNHTIRSEDDNLEIDPIKFPEPRIRVAVKPVKQGDEEKMGASLNKMHEGDPSLIMELSTELKQTLLHAQGDVHLNVAKWILKNEYGVEVEFSKPRISYRETIRKEAQSIYRHKKQTGGAGQFGEVHMKILPYHEGIEEELPQRNDVKIRQVEVNELDWGGKLIFCNAIVGASIDARFMPAIMKGIMEIMQEAPLTGSYARDIVVIVYDGKMHPVDSNENAFKTAGKMAFREAFLEAKPMLMEPIYTVEVLTPSEYMGDIMTDLQGRRAMVEGMTSEGNLQKVTAQVPLAELYKYTTSLSSIAQGRAMYSREFSAFKQVPGDVQDKLVKEMKAQEAE